MNAVQYVFSVVKSCTHDYTCDNEWKRGTVTSRLRKTERVGINLPYSRKDGCFLLPVLVPVVRKCLLSIA